MLILNYDLKNKIDFDYLTFRCKTSGKSKFMKAVCYRDFYMNSLIFSIRVDITFF